MKKFILACGLLGSVALAHAETADPTVAHGSMMGHAMMHEQKMDPAAHAQHLQKALQLSDDQTVKVKKILEGADQQRKTLEDKYKPQLEALHADMKKLHEQTETQIDAVLTPKQKEAKETLHKEHGGMCMDDRMGKKMHEGNDMSMKDHGDMPMK